jgi:Siphovirus Gp157
MTESPLSLYKIDMELLELMQERDKVTEDESFPTSEHISLLAVLDKQMENYLSMALKNRSDEVAGLLRQWDAMDKTDAEEIARLKARRSQREEAIKHLENMVLNLMERSAQKRIEGQHVTLMRKKNPASVNVIQPQLVPPEYQRVRLIINAALWRRVVDTVMACGSLADASEIRDISHSTASADNSLSTIREKLKAGVSVPGCRLSDDNWRLEIK